MCLEIAVGKMEELRCGCGANKEERDSEKKKEEKQDEEEITR